jgi:hypothetical protein
MLDERDRATVEGFVALSSARADVLRASVGVFAAMTVCHHGAVAKSSAHQFHFRNRFNRRYQSSSRSEKL